MPITTCEMPGLKKFHEMLDGRFHMCSRKKMRYKVLPRVLDQIEADMRALAAETCDEDTVFHYCADLWTAEWTGQSYICHCFQWCTADMRLVTMCAGVDPFDDSKTAEHQRHEMDAAFDAYGIPLKLHGCITTDHEGAIAKAGSELCDQVRRGRGNFAGAWIPCAAHRLQLPPKHQLFKAHDPDKRQKHFAHNDVLELVRQCRATVGFFHRSTKEMKTLWEMSKGCGEKLTKHL